MPRAVRLATFRKGWENENLARYLLSRFCFVAHSSSVSDDVGSDFFCTTYERRESGKKKNLVPGSSFAIQIKSTEERFNVSKIVPYLRDLETPFFVGVCNSENNCAKLDIYSGEYIPMLFSKKGDPKSLRIDLCERDQESHFISTNSSNNWVVRFPRVTTVTTRTTPDELNKITLVMNELCSLIHMNIGAKKNREYTFIEFGRCRQWTFAGKDSITVYRSNLLKRLAEVFHNLSWLHDRIPCLFNEAEFRVYDALVDQLQGLYPADVLPPALTEPRNKLRQQLGPSPSLSHSAAPGDS